MTDTSAETGTDTGARLSEIELAVSGMTCASCANRIERKLSKLEGVRASVNYATEKATVAHPASVSTDDLLAAVEAAGYAATLPPRTDGGGDPGQDPEAVAEAALAALRRRLVLASVLALPVVALAMVPPWQFTGWQWVSLVLTTPVVTWAAWPFHRAAAVNLRHGATTMDTLVSVGVSAAYLWSVVALTVGDAGRLGMRHGFDLTVSRSGGLETVYLETAAAVTAFLLAGRYVEKRSKRRAGAALRALLDLGAKDVAVLRPAAGGEAREERVAVGELVVGDRFVVRPGEKVAADGEVESGGSAIDASLVTGEPVPAEVGAGDAVTGGTLNTSGRLVVRATRVGSDTQLARMARMVEEAQSGKAQAQRLADRVSAYFVPAVVVASLLTLAAWLLLGGGPTAAFTAAVAVLIIACPCALGLATPTALLVGTGRGAQLGILIRGPEVLESTRRVDVVVLDKTGTVTTGAMALVAVHATAGESADEVRRVAAGLESASEHPIARAVATAWPDPVAPGDFTNLEGLGVAGTVEGREALVGRPSLLAAHGAALPADLAARVEVAEAAGRTAVAVAWDGSARGVVVVSDTVKDGAAEAVRRLRDLGLRPLLLTGDNERAARAVAAEVAITEPEDVIAGVLPAEKVDVIRRLQEQGRVVAMVGDGVNDAAALAQSDLGIAMGTGADAAIEAGDLTLVRGDLRVAADAVRLSRRTLATIKGNLFWAFAYNVAALPLAAAGLLDPMVAGLAMALSSVFVVTNSLRLRRFV